MKRTTPWLILSFCVFLRTASAENLVDKETLFFDIPGLPEFSSDWFTYSSDSSGNEFSHPADIDVLKLSPADYRVVVLNADPSIFATFKLDQSDSLRYSDIVWSGTLTNSNGYAAAMCLMTNSEYFNPERDCVAVVFKTVPEIGIYKFNKWANTFSLARTISNSTISTPVGIFWAFNDFFIVDREDNRIYRTDGNGNILFEYGWDTEIIGYKYISDIAGYVNGSNIAHLFVGDGLSMHVDHLTAAASNDSIGFKTWAWSAAGVDSNGMRAHSVAYIPNVGLFGHNMFLQRLYHWSTPDTLYYTNREDQDLGNSDESIIHLQSVLGRLVGMSVDSMGWNVSSFIVDGATLDNPIAYPDSHWTAAMSPIYVTDSVVIGNGKELVIDAGVQVYFDARTLIVVQAGGALVINGTLSNPVTMQRMDYGETWAGIKVLGGALDIEGVQIQDCDSTCIYTNAPSQADIKDCWLDGGSMAFKQPVLWLNNAPSVTQTVTGTTVDDVPIGFGLYLSNCHVKFDDVKITGCAGYNSYIKTTTGLFTNCEFSGRASSYGVFFTGAGTTPNFQCCEFTNVSPPPTSSSFYCTVFAAPGAAPTFGYQGSTSVGSNVFTDSCVYIMKMYGNSVLPIIQRVSGEGPGGRNDWYQNMASGKYISWGSPYPNPLTAYYAKSQYWNREPVNISDFNPANASYFTLGAGESDPWGLCGSGPSSIGGRGERSEIALDDEEVDPMDSLFMVALGFEIQELYSNAQQQFHSIVAGAFDHQLAWQAMTHIVSCQRKLNADDGDVWIPQLLDSLLTSDSSTYETRVYGNRLLSSYRLARSEYEIAVDVLVSLLAEGLTPDDSLYVSLDIVGVQMAAGLEVSVGGLDDYSFANVPSTLHASTLDEGIRLERELLAAIGRLLVENEQPVAGILPTSYKLFQNYPNPFNPNTQIEFDLPERVPVTLKVYNTLGQEVVTVVDATLPAGHHAVMWNGKSATGADVATGVYVFRIHAGAFVDSKKMVLIR